MCDFDQIDAFEQDPAFRRMMNALEAGNFMEAVTIGQELNAKYPKIPRLLVFCASAHEELKQYDQAKELYIQAVKAAEAKVKVLDDGSDGFAGSTIEEIAEKAATVEAVKLAIYGSMDLALLRLALIHHKQGRLDLCVQELENAVAKREQSVLLNAYLALAYRDAGRTADAIKVCRKCLSLEPWSGSAASWRLVAELCGGLGLIAEQQKALKYADGG